MKQTTVQTKTAWASGDYTGAQRAMQRVTVQKLDMLLTPYNLGESFTGGVLNKSNKTGTGDFASLIFGQMNAPHEMPNVKSVTWSRSVDQQIGTCTVVFWNTAPVPLGETPDDSDRFDQPGFYTYNRGLTNSATRFTQSATGWQELLVPDRILRTFEGYGFDPSVPPERDIHMYPSGVWMIDDVTYSHDGLITVECRDVGRALVDQIIYPPVLPFPEYPLTWTRYHYVVDPLEVVPVGGNAKWITPIYESDSNLPYIGKGFDDGGVPYVDPDGGVRGHAGPDALDDDRLTYWMSVGNEANWSSAYEHIQVKMPAQPMGGVRIRAWGGPYKGYVSVQTADGTWQGQKEIPYAHRKVDAKTNVRFVSSFTIKKDEDLKLALPSNIDNAVRIRITLTASYNSGIGRYRYRTGIRTLKFSGPVSKLPATPHVDNFARPDGTLGTKWSTWCPATKDPEPGWRIKDGMAVRDRHGHHSGSPDDRVWAFSDAASFHNQAIEVLTGASQPSDGNCEWTLGLRAGVTKKKVLGVSVTISRMGKIRVYWIADDVYHGLMTYDPPTPVDMLGKRVRAELVDDTLKFWYVAGSETVDVTKDPVVNMTNEQFSDQRFGFNVGIAADNWSSSFREIKVIGLPRPGVYDRFARSDARLVGIADSGDTWKQAGAAARNGVTWGIKDKAAVRYGGRGGEMLVAMADLEGLNQRLRIRCRHKAPIDTNRIVTWRGVLRLADDGSGSIYVGVTNQVTPGLLDGQVKVWTNVPGHSFVERFSQDMLIGNSPLIDANISGNTLTVKINNVTVLSTSASWVSDEAYGTNFGFAGDGDYVSYDDVEAVNLDKVFAGDGSTGGPRHLEGNYNDFTDIVKWLCVWGGLYWPRGGTGSPSYFTYTDGSKNPFQPLVDDPVLPMGRAWGDFEDTGTHAQSIPELTGTTTSGASDANGNPILIEAQTADLPAEIWNQKTLMDGISYVRDIVGYHFGIDEYGGAIFRFPNVTRIGNYVGGIYGGPGATYVENELVELDEKINLMSLTTKISSRNMREIVLVGSIQGRFAAIANGKNPYPSGLRRVAAWTDQHFKNVKESQTMADLIALRELFTYRTNSVTIPGNPAIQIDDQVRIWESVTNEGYIHYVLGVSSQWELESGQWTYDLQTHWLGSNTFADWIFNPGRDFSEDAQKFLLSLGKLKPEDLVVAPATPDADKRPIVTPQTRTGDLNGGSGSGGLS